MNNLQNYLLALFRICYDSGMNRGRAGRVPYYSARGSRVRFLRGGLGLRLERDAASRRLIRHSVLQVQVRAPSDVTLCAATRQCDHLFSRTKLRAKNIRAKNLSIISISGQSFGNKPWTSRQSAFSFCRRVGGSILTWWSGAETR